jgi:O-antigen/teichoic acid export membrane protein
VLTYFVRIALIPVGLLYAVITARWLGPEGLGVFAAIGAILGTAAQLGNLGLPVAASRYAAEDETRVPPLIANARLTGAVSGIVVFVALALLYDRLPSIFGDVPRELLLIAALALPLTFAGAQFQAILLGRQRVRPYNFMEAMDRTLLLAGACIALVALGYGLRALVMLTVVLAAIHYTVYHVLLWPASARIQPDLALAKRMGGFSGRAYIGTLLAFLVRPVDFLLLLPAVAGTLLFPRIAASGGRDSARFTATVSRHIAWFMALACAGLAAVAWWAVPLLFGAAYRDSVLPLWILLPGVWCMAVQGILANDLGGRDYPRAILGIWSVLLMTNVGLNLVWIPRFGMVGAAASSTVAYALSLLLMGRYWLRRFPEIRATELFRLESGELRRLLDRLRHGWRPSGEGGEVSTPRPDAP